jgi:large subunit ribosomal protein L17
MLANMATSLILYKRITTTTAKAKALRTYVEPLITKSKEDSTHSRRVVFSYLKDKTAVAELFRDISPKIGERPGGYTRILKIGNRIGDNADMCILELVDYNEAMLGGEAAKTKTTRRRRATRKKEGAVAETTAPKASKTKVAKAAAPVKEADDTKGEGVAEE